jgi:adenylylsulfate kinase-like enzyme
MSQRVLWIYGLPGSGKTTLAKQIAAEWRAAGKSVIVLDGDDLRQGVNSGLGYSDDDRTENIRRAAEIAAMVCRQGFHVVAALVTPLRRQRIIVQSILDEHGVEFRWLKVPLESCQIRHGSEIWPMNFEEPEQQMNTACAP